MKTKILLSVLAFGLMVSAFSQKPTMELTFTAEYDGQYVPLDSIFIENLTQGGDTTLYTFFTSDTVLVLDYVTSIGDNETIVENTFSVSQNYPNPFNGKTTVNIYLPEKEHIKITIRNILGRELAQYENRLNRGNHTFIFYSGNENYYLFTVTGKQTCKTIKMLNTNGNTTFGGKCKIVYGAYEDNMIGYKSQKAITDFIYNLGDQLRYTGYAKTVNEVNGSDVIVDAPETNKLYVLEITEGIPCPGIPTITYKDQVYNTVLIGSQCWLKENLNVGTMINGTDDMEDNGIIEKYCYDNDTVNCDIYGGLYQWDEMMQYTTTQGAQGICPPDWHIPTDEEWKQLEGEADRVYGYPDHEWNNWQARGFDVGLNLKSTSGWNGGINGTDLYGFKALPGGYLYANAFFLSLGDRCYIKSSTEFEYQGSWDYAAYRVFNEWDPDTSGRWIWLKGSGDSVRCLRD